MIDATTLRRFFENAAQAMTENKELLTALDSATGDGDLGISMEKGFCAVAEFAAAPESGDLGALLIRAAAVLNEASPSTLGTILSVGMMSMGKALRNRELCGPPELAEAVAMGNRAIMERSKSAPGEKTILDALLPAQAALEAAAGDGKSLGDALEMARNAAENGMERTCGMKAVHGRAAYYAEKSIGQQDGGATVAHILFAAACETVADEAFEREIKIG